MNTFKRFLSLMLAVLMMLSYAPTIVYATEGAAEDIVLEEVVEEEVVEPMSETDEQQDIGTGEDFGDYRAEATDATGVAIIGDTEYETLQAAVDEVKDGETITLLYDVTLEEVLTLPAGITLNGNGKQIDGTIYAGGDLTIEGHTKVTAFSASYYDRTITIGEGACFEITGTGRVTLGYGNTFNITGSIADAKTADKGNIQPSLIIPGGISITGGNDATMNVTNAYVKIGNTSSKNSAANGKFTINFTNSIAEFTNQLTLAEPTNGKNPTFVVNVKDSVFTTAAKLCIAAPNSTVTVDNSTVKLGSYLRNSGELTIKNGSVFTGSMIQFGENGGNDGIITVDASKFTITNGSKAHAMDGKGEGELILKNGAEVSVDYIVRSVVEMDATSTFITQPDSTDYISRIVVTTYEELLAALEKDNANIKMMNDITATATQSSGYGKAGIVLDAGDVLDGNGHKLTINGANGTWDCAVAMRGGEVKNLTIAGAMRGVFMPGANGDVVINNCVFEDVIYTFNSDAGSKNYTVTIKNTTLDGWTSFSNVHKSVTFENCEFGEGSGYAFCRPYQATTFVNCKFDEGYEFDTKQTAEKTLTFNSCTYAGEAISADNNAMFYNGGIVVIDDTDVDVTNYPVKIGDVKYVTLQAAINAVKNGETITLLADITENVTLTEKVGLYYTIDGNGKNMSGTITVKALSDTNDNRRITIKNIKFVNSGDTGVDFITSNETNHYPRLTIQYCSFTGNGKDTDVAVRTKSAYDLIIKNCTGTGLHSFIQNTAGVKVTIKKVTVTESKGGLSLGTAQNVTVRGCNITTRTYGIRLDAVLDTSVTLNGNIVNAYIPVSVRKATATEYKLSFAGSGSSYTATNTDGVWCAICGTEYEEGVALNDATGNVKLTWNTDVLDESGVYGAYEWPVEVVYGDGYTKGFDSLASAMSFGYSGSTEKTIIVHEDITESMDSLEGNITTDNPNGVTIKNTIVDEWIYCSENFTIGEGVTYDATGYASGLFMYADNAVINGTVITDCYYQRYADTKLTINEPGSMTVKTETFILRYTDGDADAGIYVVGDNNDETVGLNLAVAYFYQGMINAKDADIKVGTYWQTNDTDGQGSANLVLDNSNMTVTVNEHDMKATGNSTVTLTNGSNVSVAGGYEGVPVNKDDTSAFTTGRQQKVYVAKINGVNYYSLQAAINAVKNGETITLLADVDFAENAASIVIDKAITIDGNGNKLTFNSATSAFVIQSSNVTIENMTIEQGAKDNSFHISVSKGAWDAPKIQYANITISDVDFVGGDYALCLIGENVVVDGCTFTEQDSHNIIIYSVKGESKIINNTFYASKGSNKSAVLFEGGVDNATDLSGFIGGGKLTISGNIANAKGVFFQFTNWKLVKGMELAITGNKVYGTTNKVIALYDMDGAITASGEEFKSVVVSGNVFSNTKEGRPILKEYTGTVEVSVYKNYLGSENPDYKALILGDKVTVSSYYTDEALTNLKFIPRGGTIIGYTSTTGIWGETWGNATESYVVKVYSGDDLLGTTSLNNIDGIIDGDVNVTWNIGFTNNTDEYWTVVWKEGYPSDDKQPTKVELWIDGVKVSEGAVQMNGPDGLNPVVWKDLENIRHNGFFGFGTEEKPYLINNVNDLVLLQEKVDKQASDGSTQFAGKYFKLTADIDLAGINWNPIGSMTGDHGSFKGVFDGDGHTISNLNCQQAGNGLGLFARTAGNAEIKNLTLNNVTVKSTNNSNYVGAVVGNSYASTKITNVHVTGNIDISGRGYIGGISGHGYVVMDNVSVVGSGTVSSTFWCAGGILGYGGEGSTNIMNAHVEGITITSAAGGLGAIVGMAEDNNGTQPISGSNLSAKNVKIETYTGAYGDAYANYALGYLYGGNPTSKLTGTLTIENVTITTSSGEEPKVNDAVASIGTAIYFDLQTAINAGGEVKLLRDVTLTEGVTIPAGKTVTLDLAGYTISQTKAQTEAYQMILNDGNLTINDSVGGGKISYTDSGNGGEYISDTIYNRGVLVINGGTIENLSDATVASNGYPHAVDTYSGIRDTSVTINGGTIYCEEYSAIRMFCVSATNKADLVINGGTVKGAIDMQNGIKDAALGSLTIKGGTFETTKNANNIRFANWNGGATEYGITAAIEGGSFNGGISTAYVPTAANWNSKIISGGTFSVAPNKNYIAEGYTISYDVDNGVFNVVAKAVASVNGVYYPTLAAAIDAAKEGKTIYLISDVVLEDTLVIPADAKVTIDLNGKTISQEKACTKSYEMILNKGSLTITGDGKISFTDTSAGDPNFGWGSYTIRNEGTLVVENGTIEHKGAQAFASHMICAIFQYSGSTTINGGTISTPNYRSVRLWKGDMTIKGGTFDGQVWVQCVDNTAYLAISGGTFEPNGGDASSVFVSNGTYDAELSVTNGTFNGKIGASNATNLAGPVKGGLFSATAKENTEVALLADGFDFADELSENGYYEIVKGLKGSGREEKPYVISNAEELELFRASVNKGKTKYNAPGVYVALGADIDMAGATWERGIGDGINATFDGIFDGKGFAIKNLNLAPEADSDGYICGGLFGYTYGAAVIKNLVLENITVKTEDEGHNVGALVGLANNNGGKLTVSNVTVKNVTIDAPNAYGVGAIVGYSYRSMGTIENCYVDGATIEGYSFVGGITGYSYSNAVISGCSVKNATIKANHYSVGGIAGIVLAGNKVTGCTVENVTVSGEANVGNVVGAIAANGIIVENCTAAEPKVGGNYSDNKLVEARIGNAYYATFAAAYEAAKADETVTLVADVALAETFTIEKAITIDLGGKTVTGADGAIVFNVKAATIINNGTIKGNKSGTSSGLLDIYADLTMDGVTVETSKIIALRFKAGECTATLTDCNVTGAFKGYGGSVWNIVSGTYKASSTSISEQINGTASVSGGTFHYEIKETVCAPGYVVVDNGDGTWTVKYAPAAFVDANNNGVLDEGEAVYGNLDQVFANHKSGDVYVVLTADIVANEKVDTTANAKYYFTTNVAEGVTMDFLFADDWNYIQKASIGENITLNAKYFLGWTDIDLYGTINTTYAYFTGADVTIHEGAVLNAKTGDATVQVKDNTTLTVNGTVNTAILNVWVNVAKLIVSGKNAEVNASWIDIWDGTPSVTVENGATLDVDKIKASRGGSITVADATLLSDEIELGHNGESKGEMTITGNSTVTVSKIILTVVGSTVTGPEGLNVTTTVENSKVVYENGVYKVVGFVYVAEVNGVQYETVSEAIMAAFVGTNKEVVLLKSVEIEKVGGVSTLILYNGIILDLNGYSLTVDNFVALGTAQIIDSSNAKTGVLVAPKAGVVFNPANSQMPIWVGEGYKFASIVVNAMIDETNSSSNKLTLIFWPNFGKLNNIFANDDDKHINVSVVISWEKANGTRVSEKFTVSDALVKNVYTNGSAFSLAITGVENIKNIETYVVVESAKGVEARSQTFDYNVSDNLTE